MSLCTKYKGQGKDKLKFVVSFFMYTHKHKHKHTNTNTNTHIEGDDIYDIYLVQLGFHPVAAAGKLVKK
jgi:hypothetical protein